MPDIEDRDRYERRLTRELAAALGIQEREAMVLLGADLNVGAIDREVQDRWRNAILIAALPILARLVQQSATIQADELGGLDDAEIAGASTEYMRSEGAIFAGQIIETTVASLNRIAGRALEAPLTEELLRQVLRPVFGPVRAARIARTEITRFHNRAEGLAIRLMEPVYNRSGRTLVRIWQTRPEASETGPCPLCAPLDGRLDGDGWNSSSEPPLHVNCVCVTRTEVREGFTVT